MVYTNTYTNTFILIFTLTPHIIYSILFLKHFQNTINSMLPTFSFIFIFYFFISLFFLLLIINLWDKKIKNLILILYCIIIKNIFYFLY